MSDGFKLLFGFLLGFFAALTIRIWQSRIDEHSQRYDDVRNAILQAAEISTNYWLKLPDLKDRQAEARLVGLFQLLNGLAVELAVRIDARVKCTFRRRGDVMNTKIADLMAKRVITAQPHHSIEHVRGLMQRNRIHSVPVVGPENVALGIVTSADLAADLKAATPVQHVMSGPVHSVPAYNDVSVAARIMRKNKVHHVVVTHEKRVVGLISSFDLLKLVEGRRFVSKQGPSDNKHSGANKRGSTNEG